MNEAYGRFKGIGMGQAVLWRYPLEEALNIVEENGFDLIELWAEHPDVYNSLEDKNEASRLKEILSSHGLKVTVHAPCHDVNIASINDGIRKESVRQITSSVKLASYIDASVVTVHPGRRSSKHVATEIFVRNSVASLKEISLSAEELDVIIGVENMENRPNQFVIEPKDVTRLVTEVGSDHVGITFDAAHANTLFDPVRFMREIRELIVHIHLSNNFGKEGPVHLPLDTGNIDIAALLRELNDSGYSEFIALEGGGEFGKEAVRRNSLFLRKLGVL